ncbi:tetratricopeptide repeat protein, partial [Chlorobaculum thiosulfatiphilum]|uniref:tetratricopeptide repeat protein n=1 Tax=Chlorobaculum thiosulfatiphilum TaxID=115852 RepID=UPI001B87BD5C
MAITLLARLGRACSWQKLQKLWREQGTASAAARHPDGRLDSLDLSFALTEKLLAREPGALDLWQFVALFPDGLDEESMALWEEVSGHATARIVLVEHNLISFRAERITMLPPVARYALGRSTCNLPDENGFNWLSARNHAYQYFLAISRYANDARSTNASIQSRSRSSAELWAIGQLCGAEKVAGCFDLNLLWQLHRQLRNVYVFNILAGQVVLKIINEIIGDPLSFFMLGNLEYRLGKVDTASENFAQAIMLYEKEQDRLGLANVQHSLGELKLGLGEEVKARESFEKAKELYEKEQNQLGLANALLSLGDLERQLGELGKAREDYERAKELYEREQNQLSLAHALKFLGDLEAGLGEVVKARESYERAIELYKKEQSQLGEGHVQKSWVCSTKCVNGRNQTGSRPSNLMENWL